MFNFPIVNISQQMISSTPSPSSSNTVTPSATTTISAVVTSSSTNLSFATKTPMVSSASTIPTSTATSALSTSTPSSTPLIIQNFTELFKELHPYGDPRFMIFRSLVYFTFDDKIHGDELWITDGNMIQLFIDIYPGPDSGSAFGLTVLNSTYFLFRSYTPQNGSELYGSDGTVKNTILIKDIMPGPESGCWFNTITIFKSKGYFTAQENYKNMESIWVTDGSAKNTYPITLVSPLRNSYIHSPYLIFQNKFYFKAWTSTPTFTIWESDGTSNGTRIAIQKPTGTINNIEPYYNAPPYLTILNNIILISLDDSIHGYELWSYNPLTNSSMMIKDINPGPNSSYPVDFTINQNKAYFFATLPDDNLHMMVTDGTTLGTKVLVPNDVISYSYSSNMMYIDIVIFRNLTLFIGKTITKGYQVWSTDGTVENTIAYDILPKADYMDRLIVFRNKLYFRADITENSLTTRYLVETDGTKLGTIKYDIEDSSTTSFLNCENGATNGTSLLNTAMGLELYFHARFNNGKKLWCFV